MPWWTLPIFLHSMVNTSRFLPLHEKRWSFIYFTRLKLSIFSLYTIKTINFPLYMKNLAIHSLYTLKLTLLTLHSTFLKGVLQSILWGAGNGVQASVMQKHINFCQDISGVKQGDVTDPQVFRIIGDARNFSLAVPLTCLYPKLGCTLTGCTLKPDCTP